MDEWINKIWYVHTKEYYSALKRKEVLRCAAAWMKLEDIMLSEISQSQRDKYCVILLIWGSLSSVQSLSHVQLFVTPWTAARQASLSIANSWSLLKLMFVTLVMPSNHLILCCPFLLLPSIFPIIKVFSNESALRIRWPKYWSFSFNISPSNEHPGMISFRMDWLDLLAVQGTLNSLLQHHNSKASILLLSAFFIVQLSHSYMTTGKTLLYSFPNLEPVCCSMSSSNCCFLTCIQIFQEAGKVVWYSHLLKNFPRFVVIHIVKGFSTVNEDLLGQNYFGIGMMKPSTEVCSTVHRKYSPSHHPGDSGCPMELDSWGPD